MLELPILAIYVTCIAVMIRFAAKKREIRPPWEKENGKDEIEEWLKGFLAKLKRTSTRTEKCRLISSVERMHFKDDGHAIHWQYVQFGEDEVEIFWPYKDSLDKIKLTDLQKNILKTNGALKNEMINRSEIKEENGKWELPAEMIERVISEGGEALVLSRAFGDFETAVRVQIFDPFLFAKNFGLSSLFCKIHFEKGRF